MATFYVAKGTTNVSGTYAIAGGDTVYFSEGGQIINAGVDFSGLGSAIAAMYVEPRFAGSIDPSAVMKANITTFRYSAGGGSWRIQAAGFANVVTTLLHVGQGRMYMQGGGTFTNYEQASGYGYASADVVLTNIRMSGGQLDQLYSASANTDWFIESAVFNTGRGFSGNAFVVGGAQVSVSREDTGATLPTGATLYVLDGVVKWRGGNLTAAYVGSRGMLDVSEAPNAFTLGTLNGTAKGLARSKLSSKYATVTITTINQWVGDRAALYSLGQGLAPISY